MNISKLITVIVLLFLLWIVSINAFAQNNMKNEGEHVAQDLTAQEWYSKAQALMDDKILRKPKEAIQYLDNAIKSQPDFADAYIYRGKIYESLGHYQQAIDDCNTAIRLKPDNADAYICRGYAYGKLGQNQREMKDCNTAIRLQPDNADAYICRGHVYLKQDQYQQTIKDCSTAIRLKSDDAKAYIIRGGAYLLQGNNKLSCIDAKKACARGNCDLLEFHNRNRTCH